MSTHPCLRPGCEMIGVLPGFRLEEDGSKTQGYWCFPDDPGATPATNNGHEADGAEEIGLLDGSPPPVVGGVVFDDPAESTDFHTDVVNGLAAMILEHTAMTFIDSATSTEEAMTSLAQNTAFTNDVAAAILLATTGICAAGQVDPSMLTELAEVYEAQIEDDEDAERDHVLADLDDDDDDDDQPGSPGDLPDDDDDQVDDDDDLEMTCPACDGSGKDPTLEVDDIDGSDCATCEGRGSVPKADTIVTEVVLPPEEQAEVEDLMEKLSDSIAAARADRDASGTVPGDDSEEKVH